MASIWLNNKNIRHMSCNTAGTFVASPSDWSFKTTNLKQARDHCIADRSFFGCCCNMRVRTAVEED